MFLCCWYVGDFIFFAPSPRKDTIFRLNCLKIHVEEKMFCFFINDKKKKKEKKNTVPGVEMWVCQETVNQNILKEKKKKQKKKTKRFPTYPIFFSGSNLDHTQFFLFGLG